jgi:L-alanine-DL-glutamate epimerase-like enolase superfamily enzyme
VSEPPDDDGGARALPAVTVERVRSEPLSVPLLEPFVIASGRIEITRAVLIEAVVARADGGRATGYGEAAALPPVTREDQPELLAAIAAAAPGLEGTRLERWSDVTDAVVRVLPGSAVARAGVEVALIDAWARAAGVPLAHALGLRAASPLPSLVTDMTLPISAPDHMAGLARRHRAAGFNCFKVKVGRDWRADRASLRAVAAAVPDARFRLDANAGFQASDALALLEGALGDGLTVECFEQPCAVADLQGMAQLCAASPVPIVADESFRGADDLDRLLAARAAHAINLKLVKLGGPLAAVALGRRARAAGLRLMAGAMVETRVGLLAMAHVVAALGGVDWVDLDTAFLLASDPFVGGWQVTGARIDLTGEPGLGVNRR